MNKFESRAAKQLRAMRRYSRALGVSLEKAAVRWCSHGCAKRWAEQN